MKTSHSKNIASLCIAMFFSVLFHQHCFSQSPGALFKTSIQEATHVVEATVLNVETITDSKYVTTLITLNVHKDFKNSVSTSEIKVKYSSKIAPERGVTSDHEVTMPEINTGYQGVFQIDQGRGYAVNGITLYVGEVYLYPTQQLYNDYRYSHDLAFFSEIRVYDIIATSYNDFLNKLNNAEISYDVQSNISVNLFIPSSPLNPFETDAQTKARLQLENEIKLEEMNRKAKEWQAKKKEGLEKAINDVIDVLPGDPFFTPTGSANLTLDDFKYVYDGTRKYLQFTASLSDDVPSSYFNGIFGYLQYNSNVFGPNVAQNGLIFIPGPTFATPGYYYNTADNQPNTLFIVGFNDQSNIYPEISEDGLLLGTFKFPVVNCGSVASELLTDLKFVQGPFTYGYAMDPSGNPSEDYASINFDSENHNACVPVITGVENRSIAGNDNSIKITGKFFGEGNGGYRKVDLPNADAYKYSTPNEATNRVTIYDDGTNKIGRIVNWSDTEIEVFLPHEGYRDVITNRAVPGSGSIRVQSALQAMSDFSSNNPEDLNLNAEIPGAFINYQKDLTNHVLLHAVNSEFKNEYIIDVHQDIANTAGALSCIRKAFFYWKCAAGVDFKMGQIVSGDVSQYTPNDNKSVIYAESLSSGVHGITYRLVDPSLCGQDRYRKEVDIAINKDELDAGDYYFSIDPNEAVNGEIDFLRVLIHELGHALGLDHAINNDQSIRDIMAYASSRTSGGIRYINFTDNDIFTIDNFLTENQGVGCGTALSKIFPSDCNPNDDFDIYGMHITSKCAPEFSATGYQPILRPYITNTNQPLIFEWSPLGSNTAILDDPSSPTPKIKSASGTSPKAHFLLVVTNANGISKTYEFERELTTAQKFDYAMHDSYHDDFEEPNNTPQPEDVWNLTNSPDIWNSYTPDGLDHQDPEYKTKNDNYLRVRITNIGCITSTPNSTYVKLYWTKGSAGEDWMEDWDGTGFDPLNPGQKSGGILTSGNGILLEQLDPGQEIIKTQAWRPINPADYPVLSEPFETSEYRSVCVLARIVQPGQPNEGMSGAEHVKTTNNPDERTLEYNVQQFNDVITRNLKVYNRNITDIMVPTVMRIKNTSNLTRNLDVRIVNSGLTDLGNIAAQGLQTVIYLDYNLMRRWEKKGALGSGFERIRNTNRLIITDPNSFVLRNIEMRANESANLKVQFIPLPGYNPSAVTKDIQFAVAEYFTGDNRSVGAVHFLIKGSAGTSQSVNNIKQPDNLTEYIEAEVESYLETNAAKLANSSNLITSESGFALELKVYPNPSNGFFNLSGYYDQATSLQFEVTNAEGKVISTLQKSVDGNFQEQIDLSTQPAGVYNLVITTNGQRIVRTLVKN